MGDDKGNFSAKAMKYFGKREGQSIKDFADEIKALPYEDKVELAAMLSDVLGEKVTVTAPN